MTGSDSLSEFLITGTKEANFKEPGKQEAVRHFLLSVEEQEPGQKCIFLIQLHRYRQAREPLAGLVRR